MPNISISDFTDFVLKIGTPKITKVAEIFRRDEYHPAHDFWKPLRDAICEFHEDRIEDLTFPATGAAVKKRDRYEEVIRFYRKFLSSNSPAYFKPHRAEWLYEDLAVRINPEVGLTLNGVDYLVKLYFKSEPLAATRVQVSLALMSAGQANAKYKVAILDVLRMKLHVQGVQTPQMDALLKGEAATFLAIWRSLG